MSEVIETKQIADSRVQKIPRIQMLVQATCLRPSTAVSGWWARAAANTSWPFNVSKGVLMVHDDIGNKIATTRNQLVSRVLEMESTSLEVTDIAWLDDDVLPISPLCWRALLSHDYDIRAGVYFSKEEYPQPLIFPACGRGTDKFIPNKCYKVWGVGMGLTIVKTAVYRKMLAVGLPKDEFGYPEWYKTTGADEDLKIGKDGVLHAGGTEDLFFCQRAAELGFETVIDTGKHAFGFHYDLASLEYYPKLQWDQHRKNQPITWETPDGIVKWE